MTPAGTRKVWRIGRISSFVCFDYLITLVTLITMMVIVIIFHIIYVIMSVIHGPLRWHWRTQEARALARGSWREPRQLKKYPRSRRQVEISEGVRNKQRER